MFVPVEEIPWRCDTRFSFSSGVRGQHRSKSVKVLFWVAETTGISQRDNRLVACLAAVGREQSSQKETWQPNKTKEEQCESSICQFNCALSFYGEHFNDDKYAPVSGRLTSSTASDTQTNIVNIYECIWKSAGYLCANKHFRWQFWFYVIELCCHNCASCFFYLVLLRGPTWTLISFSI